MIQPINNDIRKKFQHALVITKAAEKGTVVDMKMVQVFAGMLTNQHIIEQMFQDIITNGKRPNGG